MNNEGHKTSDDLRKEIYEYILEYPGLHLMEIRRKLELSKSSLYYHLKKLRRDQLIVEISDGRYKRYYPYNHSNEIDKRVINLMRQELPRKIVFFILFKEYVNLAYIAKGLDRDPRTIAFHLKKLKKFDIIEEIPKGNEKLYRVKGIERLVDIFINYHSKLFDEDAIKNTSWLDRHFFERHIERMSNTLYNVFPHPYHI